MCMTVKALDPGWGGDPVGVVSIIYNPRKMTGKCRSLTTSYIYIHTAHTHTAHFMHLSPHCPASLSLWEESFVSTICSRAPESKQKRKHIKQKNDNWSKMESVGDMWKKG